MLYSWAKLRVAAQPALSVGPIRQQRSMEDILFGSFSYSPTGQGRG